MVQCCEDRSFASISRAYDAVEIPFHMPRKRFNSSKVPDFDMLDSQLLASHIFP